MINNEYDPTKKLFFLGPFLSCPMAIQYNGIHWQSLDIDFKPACGRPRAARQACRRPAAGPGCPVLPPPPGWTLHCIECVSSQNLENNAHVKDSRKSIEIFVSNPTQKNLWILSRLNILLSNAAQKKLPILSQPSLSTSLISHYVTKPIWRHIKWISNEHTLSGTRHSLKWSDFACEKLESKFNSGKKTWRKMVLHVKTQDLYVQKMKWWKSFGSKTNLWPPMIMLRSLSLFQNSKRGQHSTVNICIKKNSGKFWQDSKREKQRENPTKILQKASQFIATMFI